MNCGTCKVNKIGPNTSPYGGYLCGNEHLQCKDCNAKADGQCGICEVGTNFVQMNFNEKHMAASVTPTAPPLDSQCDLTQMEVNSSCVFPQSFFADIETQSSISQEQLSMHDSRESIGARTKAKIEPKPLDLRQTLTRSPDMATEETLFHNSQERAQMQTLFFGNNQQPNSTSNFTFQFCMDNGIMQVPQGMTTAVAGRVVQANDIDQNDSVFLYPEDEKNKGAKDILEGNEDPNVIHTSEIRFMESTESLKNYYSGGTMHPSVRSKLRQEQHHVASCNQPELLSTKMLHDFDCQNSANPSELVENYLRTYGPLALCQFPAYSFNHGCYPTTNYENWTTKNPRQLEQMRSICVSTESEPSLAGLYSPKKVELPHGKYPPQDFFVMTATGVGELATGTIPTTLSKADKIARPSLDLRMQKVLETFQEDPRPPRISQKPVPTKNFVRIHVPPEAPKAPVLEVSAPTNTQQEPRTACKIADEQSTDLTLHLSSSHRAYYNPPPKSIGKTSEPAPQFQHIGCSSLATNELLLAKTRFLNMQPMSACHLNIPRSPIQCPASLCQRMIFVSDFNKHLVVDHTKLPMERISPRQCKNFFLDPHLTHMGINKCHLLYLVRDKIIDLGSSKFKDFLPLLVMSTRVGLSELCSLSDAAAGKRQAPAAANEQFGDAEYLMIWLTGIVPEEFPVFVSLTVWLRSGNVPVCHLVHSGEMYSIRKPQRVADVCQSGQMLLLSAQQLQLLTNDGTDMLELQIIVH